MQTDGPEPDVTLAGADWLRDPRLQRLMTEIAGADEEIRIVGGAVRNALLGLPVADVDLATTALPDIVMARARRAGFHPVPTGIAHGTVTVVVGGHPFEVTTLRQDVETDGRRAVVAYGSDWLQDALRRDFTINALYCQQDGRVIDLVGGIADCRARRVRFIGTAADRIREDYLRILRFFRFHAAYAEGPPDEHGLAACAALKSGIARLSAERIGREVLKLLPAPGAPAALRVMHAAGILELAVGPTVDLDAFCRLHALAARAAGDELLLLAALAEPDPTAAEAMATRLRLSNADRDRMSAAVGFADGIPTGPGLDLHAARSVLYHAGAPSYRDAVLIAAARCDPPMPEDLVAGLLTVPDAHPRSPLPVTGADLLRLGHPPGRGIGATLRELEARWIDSDFTLDGDGLLATLAETE